MKEEARRGRHVLSSSKRPSFSGVPFSLPASLSFPSFRPIGSFTVHITFERFLLIIVRIPSRHSVDVSFLVFFFYIWARVRKWWAEMVLFGARIESGSLVAL